MSRRAVEIEEVADGDDGDVEMGVLLQDVAQSYDYSVGPAGAGAPTAKEALRELELRKEQRSLIVPTDDRQVRLKLRAMGEPITCFGEGPGERRERLKKCLSLSGSFVHDVDVEAEEHAEVEEEFYTPGSEELLSARRWMAEYSLPRSRQRVSHQSKESKTPLSTNVQHRKRIIGRLKEFTLFASQAAADRPVGMTRFSPDSSTLAMGSWSGTIKLYTVPDLSQVAIKRGHTDRVGGIAWHPQATLDQSQSAVNLVSGGADGLVHLWSLQEEIPIRSLSGHDSKVNRVEFHPSGRLLGSTSLDQTWRLWDVEQGAELLVQEGHSREVYSIAFQDDGALAATGGMDAIGRIWDLRTGRTIMVLDGHVKAILGLDFSPTGYQVASASSDASVKIWDIRKVSAVATIPAHLHQVTDVRFFKTHGRADVDGVLRPDGTYFVSGGQDSRVNVSSNLAAGANGRYGVRMTGCRSNPCRGTPAKC